MPMYLMLASKGGDVDAARREKASIGDSLELKDGSYS
jgi:hypothetical protein